VHNCKKAAKLFFLTFGRLSCKFHEHGKNRSTVAQLFLYKCVNVEEEKIIA
jgi:hypothetical protein